MPRRLSFLFGACAATGVIFWFIVGFPFDHHNESYVIASQLRSMDLWSATFGRVFPVANLRPAGQGLMWIALAIPSGLALIQIFNAVCTVVAFVVALRAVRARASLSLALCATGAVLFAGYIFLFHMHGVFYGPLLFLAAFLVGSTPAMLDGATVRRAGFITLGVLLFHPYAIFLFAAWLLAALVAGTVTLRTLVTRDIPMLLGVVVVAGVLLLLPPREAAQSPTAMFIGGMVSYGVVEVHPLVTVFIGLLIALTIATMWGTVGVGGGLSLVAASIAAFLLGLPTTLIWILVCLVKAGLSRRWTQALLLAMTTVFPFPTATGSPTYGIFAILLATVIMADGTEAVEERWHLSSPWISGTIVGLALVAVVLVRSDVRLPGVESLARPLKAEREKTAQLQRILDWNRSAEGPHGSIVLSRLSLNPTAAPDVVDRRFRPPTSQAFLDRFEYSVAGRNATSTQPEFLVTFGGDSLAGRTPLLSFPGASAGPALVYTR